MIDLHSHILPGVDDGAKTIEDSLDMARLAVEEGITHLLATPHHMNRDWMNEKSKVIELVKNLQTEIDREGIPLTLFPGQEIRIYGDILEDIEKNLILFTDEQQQYLLIEFPTSSIPTYTERLFYDLQTNGKTPVIVHPERNRMILEDPDKLKELVEHGALAQLTAASYTGGFGKEIKKFSKQLIEANLVHFIASDAHNTTNRAFHMQEAHDNFIKDYGRHKWHEFHQTTKDLINGDVIIPPTPTSVEKKKFFGLF
ncbi:tyrosine-protein phosphatase [Marinilactibacillus kalidii]|uniref:tyrosine-protein phosphatase n=1 Tax=Marinilactibacillus kalidii TaxID=2820274 RepID=UPI001ABDC583|nr:CpsB/CapC family capsule biosynthesis tyrosine phosphatase [Marinilactibacillus kalidii]